MPTRSRAPRQINNTPPTPKQVLDHLELCRQHLDAACEEVRTGTASRAQIHVTYLMAGAEWVRAVLGNAMQR